MNKELKRFIISDLDDITGINHCNGCFGCFFKTPGQCLIDDPCQNQGQELGHCDEIIVISKLVYGGYSPKCKIRLDRSLPYTHGDFHIFHGQMHHKGRYENDPVLKVFFYGPGTDQEKETAKILVERNSYNLSLNHYEVNFAKTKEEALKLAGLSGQANATIDTLSIGLVNGSPRAMKGASGTVMKELKEYLQENLSADKYNINEYFFNGDTLGESLNRHKQEEILKEDHLVFIFPLYLDSLPSNSLSCLYDLENLKKAMDAKGIEGKEIKVSVIALAGLHEGVQTETALNIMRYWTKAMNYNFVQGCGYGGCGALTGLKKIKPGEGVKKSLLNIYKIIGNSISKGEGGSHVYQSIDMPIEAYKESCESVFRGIAQKNGLTLEDMGRRL